MDANYLVKDIPGFTPHIGRLVSMMNYARETTLHAVRDLSIEQLDIVPAGFGNSIGALLAHFAAVEFFYQVRTFENRRLEDDDPELEPWLAALDLGERVKEIMGKPLAHYLEQLETIRNITLEKFRNLDDEWLHQEFAYNDTRKANYYWCWFHVFEDEINHRGQIRLIRKFLPQQNQKS
jgi:uncharacterized damage-inducible protein DinB